MGSPSGDNTGVAPVRERGLSVTIRTATEIAARAAELVGGDREKQHGSKRENFTKIAEMWNAYMAIRRDLDAPFDALDVGHMMAAMKLARTQLGAFNLDNYVDGAGYFACAGEIALLEAEPGYERVIAALNGLRSVDCGCVTAAPEIASLKVGDTARYVSAPGHNMTIGSIDKEFGIAYGACSCGAGTASASLSDLVRVPA